MADPTDSPPPSMKPARGNAADFADLRAGDVVRYVGKGGAASCHAILKSEVGADGSADLMVLPSAHADSRKPRAAIREAAGVKFATKLDEKPTPDSPECWLR